MGPPPRNQETQEGNKFDYCSDKKDGSFATSVVRQIAPYQLSQNAQEGDYGLKDANLKRVKFLVVKKQG
jgi:hypothetical protein